MPTVSDLDRLRGTGPGAFGVGPAAVPAHHRDTGMGLQPSGERVPQPIVEDIDRPVGAHID